MTGGVLGGGVIFVVAALLWAAVLVPAWVRRREFRAAERNALRLQRTLRVLAETSEVPQEVRVEATAREALAHERLLRTARKTQEAERAAELADARAEQLRAELRAQEMRRRHAAAKRSARLRRPIVRRTRAVAALCALAGVIGVLIGAGFAIAGSGAAVLAWSALLFSLGLGALVLLAPGRARMREVPAERVERPARDVDVVEVPEDGAHPAEDPAASAQAHAAAQRAAAERIARAQARARARTTTPAPPRENQPDSILLREAREQVARERASREQASRPTLPMSRPAAPASAQHVSPQPASAQAASGARQAPAPGARQAPAPAPGAGPQGQQEAARARLREMGVVGDTSEGMPDLDAAIRRRRQAG